MKLFIRFLFAKWIFNKPRKKDILIYDKTSEKVIYLIFNKRDCDVMHVRYEWGQIIHKYIGDIMEYDPKNTRFYKIMKKLNLPTLAQ